MEVNKIKKILTAIGNPFLNNELKKYKGLAVIESDIQYKEGILEILEINNKIDYIILSELIPGEIGIDELIEKIKIINDEVKIVILIDEKNKILNKKIKEKINSGEIFNYFYNNTDIKIIINLINENEKLEKYNSEIKKEIDELKKLINNEEINNNIIDSQINKNIKFKKNNKKINNKKINNKKINNNKINNNKNNFLLINNLNIIKNKINYLLLKNIKKIKIIILKKYNYYLKNIFNCDNLSENLSYINKNKIIKNKGRIISILGNNGSGKSTFCVMLADLLKQNNKKILIIDFDVLNNSLHTIFGVKKYSQKIKEIIKNNNLEKINIDNLIIKINNKIDLISGINIFFKYKNTENNINLILNKLLNGIFNEYDFIIIDTTSECFFEYTKEIIKMSDNCFFLTEANLTEISKSKRLLEIYSNDWNIENNKIKIIFNKYNNNCIDFSLLKKLYFDYEIIGKIKSRNNYDFIFNNKDRLSLCKKNIIKLLLNNKIKINN